VVVDFAHVSASYSRHGYKNVTPYNIIVVYSVRKKPAMGVKWADGSRYGPREHTRDARSLEPGGNKRLLDRSYNDRRRRRTGELRSITILLIIYCLRRSPAPPPLPKLFIVNRRVSYHPNHARIRVRTSTTGFARARDNSN